MRGFVNSPTNLALKNIMKIHKPDMCILVEPWLNHLRFPLDFWDSLGLKLFVVNNRSSLELNISCICKKTVIPHVQTTDQFVVFSILIENIKVCFAAMYASTYYIKRRGLWSDLSSSLTNYNVPWCLVGDYNSILGTHECRGSCIPLSTPM